MLSIPLMITLLARCGDILTGINRNVLIPSIGNLLEYRNIKLGERVSPELLSAITITVVLVLYIHVGIVVSMSREDWTYVDATYFWIVTFTTVGFGDQTMEIRVLQGALIVYRMFGLALLAGVIDSLVAWIKMRKEQLKKIEEAARIEAAKKMHIFGSGLRVGMDDFSKALNEFRKNALVNMKSSKQRVSQIMTDYNIRYNPETNEIDIMDRPEIKRMYLSFPVLTMPNINGNDSPSMPHPFVHVPIDPEGDNLDCVVTINNSATGRKRRRSLAPHRTLAKQLSTFSLNRPDTPDEEEEGRRKELILYYSTPDLTNNVLFYSTHDLTNISSDEEEEDDEGVYRIYYRNEHSL